MSTVTKPVILDETGRAIERAILALSSGQATQSSVTTLQAAVENLEKKVLPSGGESGQILSKKSGTDFDTEWIVPPATGTTYDDTAVQSSITTIQAAIDKLNGTGEGSVSKTVADAIEAVPQGQFVAMSYDDETDALVMGDNSLSIKPKKSAVDEEKVVEIVDGELGKYAAGDNVSISYDKETDELVKGKGTANEERMSIAPDGAVTESDFSTFTDITSDDTDADASGFYTQIGKIVFGQAKFKTPTTGGSVELNIPSVSNQVPITLRDRDNGQLISAYLTGKAVSFYLATGTVTPGNYVTSTFMYITP